MFVCGLLAGGIPTFVLATDLLNGSMAFCVFLQCDV